MQFLFQVKKNSFHINNTVIFKGDVTDPNFPEILMEKTIQKFGKLNILVNNAGYKLNYLFFKKQFINI